MAFIYEVNGQRVEFEKEPTEKDIDEAARSLGQAKPESRMPKPVEGEGGAAFGVYRPAGRRPESQQDREASKEMPLQTARGIVTGGLGLPSDILNLPGQVYGAVTNQPSPYTVPLGSEQWNQMLPGQPTSPQGELARQAGQLLSPSAVGPVIKGVTEAGKGAVGFGKGFARGLAYPEGTSPNTALAPIRPTYVPHEQVSEFMAGNRPASTLTEVPTAPLYQNKPVANWAYGMAPENQAGQKLVPYAGRTAEGVGEQIGSQYRKNPLTGLVDIGATLATGVPAPITAIARSVPAMAAQQLQKATQFEQGFGPARAAALAREGQLGLQANMPQQPLLPSPGPVQPMIASQTGQVTAPGGLPLPTQASGSPKQVSMQVAASKIQQPTVQPVQPTGVTPEQMASWQQRANVQPPRTTTPRPQPQPPAPIPEIKGMRSSAEIKKELDMIGRQSDELHAKGLEEGIQYGTPQGESHQAQLGQFNARTKVLEKELEEALKAEKKANKPSKKGPSNVSQMLTEDTSKSKIYPNKEAFEKESIFSTLKDEPHTGSYIQGDKIIHVEKLEYGDLPKDVTKDFPKTKMYATDKSGNRVPIGKTWTDADPEPLGARVRNILDRNKGKKK